MRTFLIAFLILLWIILGWLFYRDQNRCCSGEKDVSVLPVLNQKTGPILFAHTSAKPILGDSWSMFRDSLAMFASDTTSLEIVGWYCTNLQPAETEGLALTRATEVRKLFVDIPDDHIILVTKGVTCDSLRSGFNDEAISFHRRIRTALIKETAEKTTIYFPPNSTQKLNNAEVEAYLDDVAERVLKSGESVILTGHTDNIGPDASNADLARRRAEAIKQYLLTKKVYVEKIKVTSQGESSPIADNKTKEGRTKNRRTELQIIK